MSDVRLRELERTANAGDLDARQALFVAERRAGFPNSRDPRKDPRPGDRLRRRDGIYEVRQVRFDLGGADGETLQSVWNRKVLTPKWVTSNGWNSRRDVPLYGDQWDSRAANWEVESRAKLEGTCSCGHAAADHGVAAEVLWGCLECRVKAWSGFDYPCNGFGPWQRKGQGSHSAKDVEMAWSTMEIVVFNPPTRKRRSKPRRESLYDTEVVEP